MKYSKEFKIGLLSIVALSMLYLGFNFLKGMDFFAPYEKYYANYKNIKGLSTGSSVLINGYSVGRVGEIQLMQTDSTYVKCTFFINDGITITKGAKAFLNATDPLGSINIVIENNPGREKAEPETFLASGYKQGILDQITKKTDPLLNKVTVSIESFQKLAESLKVTSDSLTESVVGILHANERSIKRSIKNVEGITASINQTVRKLDPLIAEIQGIADSVDSEKIDNVLSNLEGMSANLESISKKLDTGDGSLSKLINEDELYENLNSSINQLNELLTDMKYHPKNFVSPLGRRESKLKHGTENQE